MQKLIVFLLSMFFTSLSFAACDRNATTATFTAQLSAATAGQTICLAAGNYGTVTAATSGITGKTSPGVTISGNGNAITMVIDIRAISPAVQWLIFDRITNIAGGILTGNINNITIQNSTTTIEIDIYQPGGVTNNACSSCPAMNNANVLFTNDTFTGTGDPNASNGNFGGMLTFANSGSSDPVPAGVTVTNSVFNGTGGCYDGVDILSAGRGVTIGPGNEFKNLLEGSCSNHVDSIQFVGTDVPGPTITGNYFHNSSTGIAAYDGPNNAASINNNVVDATSMVQDFLDLNGFSSTTIVEHNTVLSGTIQCGYTHEFTACSAVLRNNISAGYNQGGTSNGGSTGTSPSFFDYNLCIGTTCNMSAATPSAVNCGAHCLNNTTPTFVGGAHPLTYAGFALTSGSAGHNAGLDGKDIGINIASAALFLPAAIFGGVMLTGGGAVH